MSTRGFKKAGFKQGIFQTSTSRKERLGTLRITQDGRMFRYTQAGGTALATGVLMAAAAMGADVMDEAGTVIHSIGDHVFSETITSATYAKDYFQDGFLHINDGTGQGYQYQIESSTAVVAGTTISLTLNDPIRLATVATTSLFSIAHSPWKSVIISATPEAHIVGVTLGIVPANAFCWLQTRGPAIVLSGGTEAVGTMMVPGGTDGSVVAITTTVDIDLPVIGRVWATAGVSGDYKPIYLQID